MGSVRCRTDQKTYWAHIQQAVIFQSNPKETNMKAMQAELELSALGEHLGLCKATHRHVFALHCAVQSMHGFIVSRFVTSLVIAGALTLLASWVL